MQAAIVHGAKFVIDTGLLIANFYFWAKVWDKLVGPNLPRGYPQGK